MTKRSPTEIAEFIATARTRFALSCEREQKFREQSLEALRFYDNTDGAQWPEEIRTQRKNDGRPVLTFPVVKQFVRQISNKIRKNKPSPIVTPVGDEDVETAEVIMGIDRKIERQSKADVARSYAALYAIITGRGWYRLSTRYESEGEVNEQAGPEIFDQEIYVDRIKNQASVYPDPSVQKADYSDMGWCFVVEDWQRDEFKAAYPNAEAATTDWSSLGDQGMQWASGATIRVAEYFYIDTENLTIALVYGPDGTATVMPLAQVPEGVEIVKKRTLNRRVVRWCKMTGVDILEEKTWPIEWIPILPVLGEELEINGETSLSGMVKDIRSAQEQYNYMRTMQTETIALAPRAPYIAAEGQIEGHEEMWLNANRRNYGVLVYNPIDVNGTVVGAPKRDNFEPAIQATTIAVGQAYEDLKRGSGIHDASLGAQGNETSGRAIIARQEEGDDANFHFSDNLTTTISHEFRMRIALMKYIYDRPGRIAQIIGEEGEEKKVILNAPHIVKGEEKTFDITTGRYDVAVTVGPSSTSKRQLAGELWMQLTKAFPPLMQVAGDVLVKSLDIPGAQEVSERLKKMLPPEVREEDDEQQQIPPHAQQQLAQSGQMIEQLSALLNEKIDELQSNLPAIQSKERIEAERIQLAREELAAKTQIEMAKIGSQEAIVQLKEDLARIRQQIEIGARAAAQEAQQQHASEQQEADHVAATQSQAAQQQAELAAAQQPEGAAI